MKSVRLDDLATQVWVFSIGPSFGYRTFRPLAMAPDVLSHDQQSERSLAQDTRIAAPASEGGYPTIHIHFSSVKDPLIRQADEASVNIGGFRP